MIIEDTEPRIIGEELIIKRKYIFLGSSNLMSKESVTRLYYVLKINTQVKIFIWSPSQVRTLTQTQSPFIVFRQLKSSFLESPILVDPQNVSDKSVVFYGQT